MFYRIRIDLAFTEEDPINDIQDKVLDHLADAIIINPGQQNEERGYIQLEKCYHDEDPPKPCQLLGTWLVPIA